MVDFLLLASFSIMLVYLIFRLWINTMPSFSVNRYFLISGILFSLLSAAFSVAHFVNIEIVRSVQIHEITVTAQFAKSQLNTILPFHINSAHIYIVGVLLLTIRFIRSLYLIFTDFIRNPKERQGRYIVVLLPNIRTPYSFFNLLFIPERDFRTRHSREVITHELIHASQWHSADVLLCELLIIILWFNPFVWLLRRDMQVIHEYIADNEVLKNGYNRQDYQKQLLAYSMGTRSFELSSPFAQSVIFKRIKMMNRKIENISIMKYAMGFALSFILIVVMGLVTSNSLVAQTDEEVYDSVEVMPEYPGGMEALQTYIAQNLSYPNIAIEYGIEGTVYLQFVVDKKGKITNIHIVDTRLKPETITQENSSKYKSTGGKNLETDAIAAFNEIAIKTVSGLANFKPGTNKGKTVKVSFTLPIKYRLS